MATFLMLTRIAGETASTPDELHSLEKRMMEFVRKECPEVKWEHNYVSSGPYNYVDIFTAPDIETAMKVNTIARTVGHAHSEIWPLTEWSDFKSMLDALPKVAA